MGRDKKISVRVTESEKTLLNDKAASAGYETLTDFVLARCLNENERSSYEYHKHLEQLDMRIYAKVTPEEKQIILAKVQQSGCKNLSRYIRNCCMGEIIVLTDLKVFSMELHKVGVNLNQITRLCNEGLITCPDITETKEELKKVYGELAKLNKKVRLHR